MVIAAITDDQGDAVLPDAASVMPTMVSKTSQGGAVPELTFDGALFPRVASFGDRG